jgi:lysophospholipase L1-like esterase
MSLRFIGRKLPLWVALVALAIGLGGGILLAKHLKLGHRAGGFARYAQVRVAGIAAQIEQIPGDYVLLLGDSHVERLYLPEICGLPTVSLGIGGARAANLLETIERLAPSHPPRAIVLTVGTNDMLGWEGAESGTAPFEREAAALVTRLRTLSRRVIATDIPAIHPAKALPDGASARYTAAMAHVCATSGCDLLPLFAEASTANPPPAFQADGVHLVDYRSIYAHAAPRLCGN